MDFDLNMLGYVVVGYIFLSGMALAYLLDKASNLSKENKSLAEEISKDLGLIRDLTDVVKEKSEDIETNSISIGALDEAVGDIIENHASSTAIDHLSDELFVVKSALQALGEQAAKKSKKVDKKKKRK